MSGWRIVPVPATKQMEHCADAFAEGGATALAAGNAAAPEPDWEALAEIAVQAYRAELTRIFDAVDRLEAGDGHNAMIAALKAALGGAK